MTHKKLQDTCIAQAKDLLEEFGEFFPFAFGVNLKNEIVPVSAYFEEEHPASQDVIAHLEKALEVSDRENAFTDIAICVDVISTPPYMNEKVDCLEIRIDSKSGNPINVYVPYEKDEEGKVEFLEEYKEEGVLNYFKR